MKALFLFRERHPEPLRRPRRDFQTDVGSKNTKTCLLYDQMIAESKNTVLRPLTSDPRPSLPSL